ncbi:MAG: hypothetical protein U0175_34350 [Caldilineaceae bacterium]
MLLNKKVIRTVAVTLLIALHLTALLLPVHTVSAAEMEVNIPKNVVDAMVYRALWQQAYQGNDALKTIIYDMFILQAGQAGMNEADLNRVIDNYMAQVDSQLASSLIQAADGQAPTNDLQPSLKAIAQDMIKAALKIPELHPFVKDVWKSVAGSLGLPTGLDQASQIGSSAQGGAFGPAIAGMIGDVLDQMVGESQSNLGVAGACDKVQKPKVKVSVKKFDGGKTAKETPSLKLPPEIIQNIQLNGSINISLNQLKDLSQTEFNNIELSLDDMQQTLNQIDAKQDVLIDYIHNQQEREEMQALAEAKAAEHKLKLDAIQSSISVISTLAGFIDPQFGKQLETVASSALQIGQSLDGWLDAVAGMNALDKIGSLSTVVMTGNILGAVMNVVNLFGSSGPSPDQMILQEIGKLRQQVDQLRTEMHDRFDRVDQELNVIYSTMQDRFDKIDIQLGKLNANILEVQRTLLDLDLKLSRIERNNFELLDALGRRPLLEAINGGLGYEQRTGHAMSQSDFENYENIFQTWGTIHAFDALATGPSQRDFSDDALLSELNAFPLDANLNYLNAWLKLKGLPGFANSRLASPRDWLFASRAYSQLGIEWPELMKQINPQREAALDAVGADLAAAMRNLSTIVTGTVPQGNSLLFTQVISNYQGKLSAIDGSLATLESDFVKNVQNNNLQRSQPFDLYGGVDQVVSYVPAELSQMSCGGSDPALATPGNVQSQLPNFDRYNLAEYLKLGQFHACMSAKLLHSKPVCQPGQDACDAVGDLQVTLTTRFENTLLSTQRVIITPVLVKAEDTPTDLAIRNWATYKSVFEFRATTDALTPAQQTEQANLLAKVTTDVHNQLASYQHQLDRNVANELSVGSLRSKATEMAGSKALLNSFVTIGLGRAVSNDDFFHAMLYGNQQLMEDSQILATFALSGTQTVTETQITANPRLQIQATANARSAAFQEMVNHYLDGISNQTHVETIDYIADARTDLDLAMRIARLEPAAPNARQLYLPLLSR